MGGVGSEPIFHDFISLFFNKKQSLKNLKFLKIILQQIYLLKLLSLGNI